MSAIFSVLIFAVLSTTFSTIVMAAEIQNIAERGEFRHLIINVGTSQGAYVGQLICIERKQKGNTTKTNTSGDSEKTLKFCGKIEVAKRNLSGLTVSADLIAGFKVGDQIVLIEHSKEDNTQPYESENIAEIGKHGNVFAFAVLNLRNITSYNQIFYRILDSSSTRTQDWGHSQPAPPNGTGFGIGSRIQFGRHFGFGSGGRLFLSEPSTLTSQYSTEDRVTLTKSTTEFSEAGIWFDVDYVAYQSSWFCGSMSTGFEYVQSNLNFSSKLISNSAAEATTLGTASSKLAIIAYRIGISTRFDYGIFSTNLGLNGSVPLSTLSSSFVNSATLKDGEDPGLNNLESELNHTGTDIGLQLIFGIGMLN